MCLSHRRGAPDAAPATSPRRGLSLSVLGALAAALCLTLAVELPLAALLGLRTRSALLAVAVVNLITNPALTYALLALHVLAAGASHPTAPYVVTLVVGELAVVFVEWRLLLWALGGSTRRILGISVAINSASVCIGLLVFGL